MIWEGFEGKAFIDRHQELYDFLRSRLSADAQRVSLLFSYTPKEVRAMDAA